MRTSMTRGQGQGCEARRELAAAWDPIVACIVGQASSPQHAWLAIFVAFFGLPKQIAAKAVKLCVGADGQFLFLNWSVPEIVAYVMRNSETPPTPA